MYEPVNAKLYGKIVCTPRKVSDQPGRPLSLIRIFAVRLQRTLVLSLQMNTKQRFRSDPVVVQSGQSLYWTHSLFCHELNHMQSNTLLYKTSPPQCCNRHEALPYRGNN